MILFHCFGHTVRRSKVGVRERQTVMDAIDMHVDSECARGTNHLSCSGHRDYVHP